MSFMVLLTTDSAGDLEELYQYILGHDAPGKAEHVLMSIEKICNSLSTSPERGAYPKELLALGIRDYREVFFKPYRVIYRVMGDYANKPHCFRKVFSEVAKEINNSKCTLIGLQIGGDFWEYPL